WRDLGVPGVCRRPRSSHPSRGPIWVPLRFHDLRHMAGTLMHEAGVPLRRAQEILGHASERTTLPICTHAMRRTRDDSVDKIADRKSTRLNSSHVAISYAVFCLKKKIQTDKNDLWNQLTPSTE